MDREVAEASLAHTVGVVEGAYLSTDVFERRHELMQRRADYIFRREEVAVPIGLCSAFQQLSEA